MSQGLDHQDFDDQDLENKDLENREQDDRRSADAALSPRSAAADPPSTGDAAVDEALQNFRERTTQADASLDEHADAGEQLHQALQERLADLGD